MAKNSADNPFAPITGACETSICDIFRTSHHEKWPAEWLISNLTAVKQAFRRSEFARDAKYGSIYGKT